MTLLRKDFVSRAASSQLFSAKGKNRKKRKIENKKDARRGNLLVPPVFLTSFFPVFKELSLHRDGGLDGGLGIVAFDGDVLEGEIVDALDLGIEQEPGEGAGLA